MDRVGLVGGVFAESREGSGIGNEQAGDEAQQGGFSRAVRADQSGDVAGEDLTGHRIQRRRNASWKGFAELTETNDDIRHIIAGLGLTKR